VREDVNSEQELRLEVENLDLRHLLAQAGIDAAKHRGLGRLQRLLLEEMHHRVKNILATVMAITSQSLQGADSLEHGRQAIAERLIALGRVHDLLLQTNWTSAPLAEILRNAIEPFDPKGAGRFFVQSSDIDVGSAAVLPLAMVLNELCTNAVKYGALSNASGRVDITATVDDSGTRFLLRWVESGGPAIKAPTRRGFGTRLIERSFASQLQGQAQLAFEPTGVVCVLAVPVASPKPPMAGGTTI
jgi:two-component sensor histidine kinase